MPQYQTLTKITALLDGLALPHSHAAYIAAEKELTRLRMCTNFVEEFLALLLYDGFDGKQKMT